MNIEDVKSLISLIDESSLTELHYQTGDFQLLLSKNKLVQSNQQSSDSIPAAAPTPAVTAPVQNSKAAVSETAAETEGKIITSPIVGVVYLAPTPDAKPYATKGQTIAKGDVVCLVEAMKLMNEIKSEFDGEIVEVLVENEQIVEFNQPLFRIV
ncbi:acetyl-CoA carboxylase biotin carboxyl carrier protein [uncultured Trichococcus sp.]|uniref:acetyl-CoA carboxylase biotin carboxyl carrier protein n=1 Tax=uncultured Trichococcus sp. TaxID=189665 RepID=UPI0029C91202|nr:acetyl-CoA carboxylase biotin carboxyl carrier protein [uncultured Trichococcus sp.]